MSDKPKITKGSFIFEDVEGTVVSLNDGTFIWKLHNATNDNLERLADILNRRQEMDLPRDIHVIWDESIEVEEV